MPTICADDIRDAAFLSVAAYAETSVDLVNYLISEGWQPVGAPELGLDPSFFGADTSDSDYLYNFENAQGFIAYKDGTLAFAFAGTNPAELGDIRDDIEGRFTDFSGYYDKFQILRDAFWKFYYENEDALSLEKPLVTGHSLGGAAAEVFMNQYGVPFQDIIGISFGSPGISDFVTPFDGRFLAIEHTDDWVVDVFGDYFAVQEIGIELSVFLSLSSDLSLEEHYRAVYLDTVRHLFGPTEGAGPADELDPNYRSLTLEAQQIIHPAYFASEAAERFGTYEVYIADAAANDIRPGADDQIVFGLNGHDTIYGGGGSDLIDGGLDNDSLLGEDGDDIIHGNRGNDTIYGGNETTESQNDQLFGDEGNDAIFGEIGNDQLDGGSGNDLLSGGAGTDNLTGGSGRDTFVIDSTASSDFDAILDYNSGDTGSYSFTEGDRIDLSALVGAAYQGGADPDDFVRIVVGPDGQTSFLQVDVDGTGGGSGWQTVASIGVLPEGALVDFILGPGANDPNHTLRIETTSAGVSPSTWSITPSVQSLTEEDGATITFTITRPDASSEQTVYVSTVQTFGAINDGDYTGLLDVPVTFLAGVLSTDVMVTISGDSVPELDETFGVIVQTVINPSPSEYVAAATFSIIDNDDVAPGGTPTDGDDLIYVAPVVGDQSLDLSNGDDRVTVDFSAFSEDVTFSAYRSGFPATYRYHVAETVDGSHRLTLHSAESFNFLGGAGNDNISTLYRSGDDQLFGGAGDDTINGAAGNDIIDGGADNDNLSAGEGNDVVRGGAGNDTIDAGEGGADAIDGGSGIDRLNLVRSSATQAFTFTFEGGSDTTLSLIDGTTITDIEHLDFTAGAENDHITYVMNTVIEGTQSLSLGDGTDRVTVDFSAFSEDVTFSAYRSGFPATYRYHVAETVDGSHRLTLHSAESFNFLGGAGNDNISTLYRSGDDKLFGGAGDDTINGAAGNDIIDGGADNDNLSAGEGNDVVRGGAGNDTIDAGEGGADAIDGGSGIDRLNLVRSSATQAFTFTFDGGSDTTLSLIDGTTITGVEIFSFTSGSGDDDITYVMDATIDVQRTSLNLGDGFDRVTVDMSAYTSGVRFDDDRFGNLLATSGNWDGSNWSQQLKISNAEAYNFLGGSGNDVIYLQDVSGDHLVFGDDGDDEIRTHDGNDILNGGGGNDSLTGGDGADTFVLSPGDGQDTITDFELGLDTIDLSAFDRSDAEDAVENAAPGSAIITFSDGTVLTIQGDNVTPETLSQNDIVFADNVEPEGSLLIEGIAKEDEVLTADVSGVSDDDGIDPATETFQWQRDGIDIPGAEGSSYTLTQDDVQKQITVVYSYTDTFGTPESVTSAPTAPVENVNDPIQGFIVLTGTPAVGETLTADGSDITDEDGIVEGSITWGWYRLNQSFQTVERIPGAHQATYTVTEDDRGYYISPRFTYEDEFGGTGVRSSVGVYVNTPPSGDVMITGLAEDGQTLTVDISGINEPDTIRDNTLTYQWRRDGLDIVDATDTTYEVTSDDVGFELSVHVTYLDGGNTREELTSAAVAITDAPQPQVLTGTPDPDVLTAGDGNDTLRGLGSNDTLTGSAGNDLIDGGPGRDTAIYSGDQASYTLTLSPTSATLADRRADGNGTDQLIDIEFLDFETEIPALGGNPMNLEMFGGPTNLSEEQFGDLIELYIAYFNRAPDSMGLYFWATAYADGQSLEEIAALFSTAAETKALYPDGSSNEIFLENVYNNVLGRLPDQGGFDFWLGHLNSGALKKETFILDLLGGAQGSDVDYLNNKVDIGTYFAVIKGMSNGRNGSEVMELFDGTQQSIEEAIEATDQFYAEALDPDDGEFLMPLVGVVDDPFAVA